MAMAWYVVHTYSGFENKAKAALEDSIRRHNLQSKFGEVLVPTEKVVEVKDGQKKTTTRKVFPGYMFVQIPEVEVRRITNQMAEDEAKPKPVMEFERGEEVRIIDGPFSTMKGRVEEVNQARGKLRVMVSIFGRPTAVELDFTQVERTG